MLVAGGFFTFVFIQVNDVGVLEVSGNIPSLLEELEQADKLLSKCLTTHRVVFHVVHPGDLVDFLLLEEGVGDGEADSEQRVSSRSPFAFSRPRSWEPMTVRHAPECLPVRALNSSIRRSLSFPGTEWSVSLRTW